MMNNEMFAIFLRDAPLEINTFLETKNLISDVDAITFRRKREKPYINCDIYVISVRYKGDWFDDSMTCNPTKSEENYMPHMREAIHAICEKVVDKIEKTYGRANV